MKAVDLYHGKVAKNADEAGHSFKSLNFKEAVGDIHGAIKYLKEQGCKKVGAVGFCM